MCGLSHAHTRNPLHIGVSSRQGKIPMQSFAKLHFFSMQPTNSVCRIRHTHCIARHFLRGDESCRPRWISVQIFAHSHETNMAWFSITVLQYYKELWFLIYREAFWVHTKNHRYTYPRVYVSHFSLHKETFDTRVSYANLCCIIHGKRNASSP